MAASLHLKYLKSRTETKELSSDFIPVLMPSCINILFVKTVTF